MEPTYEIIVDEIDGDSIKCMLCGSQSYNYNDVLYRFCARCHKYHDTRTLLVPDLGKHIPPFLDFMHTGSVADEFFRSKPDITEKENTAFKALLHHIRGLYNHPDGYRYISWKSPSGKSQFIAAVPKLASTTFRAIACFRIDVDVNQKHWLSDYQDIYIYTFIPELLSWKLEHILISE